MRRAPPNAKKGQNNLKSHWRASSSQRVLFCKERTIQLLWGQENKIKNEAISNWDNKPVVCAVSVKLIPSPALANRERKITWTDHRRTQPTAVDPEWWAPSNTVETENLTNFYVVECAKWDVSAEPSAVLSYFKPDQEFTEPCFIALKQYNCRNCRQPVG